MAKKKQGAIPKHELEALASVLYPMLKAYLESPQGQAEFQEYHKQINSKKEVKK